MSAPKLSIQKHAGAIRRQLTILLPLPLFPMSRRLFCLGTFLISALESIHALQVPNAPRTQGADIATAPYTLASRESFNAKRAAAGIALGDVDDNMVRGCSRHSYDQVLIVCSIQ